MKNIDVIGKIVDTQGTYDDEGNELTAPTYIAGVYAQATQAVPEWVGYLEDPQPTSFTRVYAGGATPTRYKFPDEASLEIALEAMEEPSSPGWTPPAVAAPLVSPVEFKLLFTAQERVAIKQLRATDELLEDFMSIIEDPRLTHVNLGLSSVIEGVDYLVSVEVISLQRAAAVKTGEFS